MNDEMRSPEAEPDHVTDHADSLEPEEHFEEAEPFLAREMEIFRSYLARAGLILMYLAGLVIVVLAIHNAFFDIRPREDLMMTMLESLIAAVGGLVLVVTTWLWKKVL